MLPLSVRISPFLNVMQYLLTSSSSSSRHLYPPSIMCFRRQFVRKCDRSSEPSICIFYVGCSSPSFEVTRKAVHVTVVKLPYAVSSFKIISLNIRQSETSRCKMVSPIILNRRIKELLHGLQTISHLNTFCITNTCNKWGRLYTQ